MVRSCPHVSPGDTTHTDIFAIVSQDLRHCHSPTLRLSSMLRETALCRELKGTVVPRSSETVVPALFAAASTAGARAAALGGAGAAAAMAGAGALLGPAQRQHICRHILGRPMEVVLKWHPLCNSN